MRGEGEKIQEEERRRRRHIEKEAKNRGFMLEKPNLR